MGRFRTYDFICQHCGNEDACVLFDLDTDDPNVYNCTKCGELSMRVFGAPTVMNAAIPDGGRRNDETWQRAKSIADLKVQEAQSFHGSEERKEIQREIKERSTPITKGGG